MEKLVPFLKSASFCNAEIEIVGGQFIWKDGTWEEGTWEDGIWKYGTWEGGIWYDGAWKGGWKNKIICKHEVVWNSEINKITIGYAIKTVEEWDAWFASTDEFETPRNDDQFKLIYNAFRVAKYAIELERKND